VILSSRRIDGVGPAPVQSIITLVTRSTRSGRHTLRTRVGGHYYAGNKEDHTVVHTSLTRQRRNSYKTRQRRINQFRRDACDGSFAGASGLCAVLSCRGNIESHNGLDEALVFFSPRATTTPAAKASAMMAVDNKLMYSPAPRPASTVLPRTISGSALCDP
jgi:hypothetical protein